MVILFYFVFSNGSNNNYQSNIDNHHFHHPGTSLQAITFIQPTTPSISIILLTSSIDDQIELKILI
ncbi:hypothetical protein DERP_007322 [Dermatophagoides pteronyssinus]|uniref:Uncharacterized protein n=1 Tax=Dermatophagoides pteronyssinus TaxID=6956 RepID=A0ABQ8J4A2_DERPT|nr:hypothetical protein DERP_007322 [Dermatophagoides pteronyssinus]